MSCCSPATPASRTTAQSVPPLGNWLKGHGDKRLVFDCPDRTVNAGFHITEIKLASISALDCGRERANWQEILLQIMDIPGSADKELTAAKLSRILSESIPATLSGESTYTIELSDGREAIRLYDVSGIATTETDVVVHLLPRTARCKAVGRVSLPGTSASNCC